MPTSKSLAAFAPQKKPKEIFAPMRQITNTLIETKSLKGPGTMFKGQQLNDADSYLGADIDFNLSSGNQGSVQSGRNRGSKSSSGNMDYSLPEMWDSGTAPESKMPATSPKPVTAMGNNSLPIIGGAATQSTASVPAMHAGRKGSFAAAGQTTQMIIGAGGESDKSILTTSENLYRTFKMKRVYYSAYIPVVDSPILPTKNTAPPLAREHRIYQADWLLRFYGFTVGELFGKGDGNLDPDVDPKVTWALRNLDMFPVEVNRASYDMLMRVPGIGATSAKRIIRQRRYAAVRYDDLKKMGVVLKRAKYFILCAGRYEGDRRFEPETIKHSLLQMEEGLQMTMFNYDENWQLISAGERQEKLSTAGII